MKKTTLRILNSTFNKKHFLSLLAIVCFVFNTNAQTYDSYKTLQTALNDAAAAGVGGTFIVKDGTYTDFKITLTNVATSADPIVVKAETVGGVTLLGKSAFTVKKAAFCTIEGFILNCTDVNTLIKFEGSNNIRITRNTFQLTTANSAKWVFIGGVYDDYTFQYASHDNRIDHNIFQNKATTGHYITVDGTSNQAQTEYRQSQNDRIDHNYFKNNGPRATNEQESIRVGWSEMSKSSGYTTVEFNLFEDCDGDPEIVSIKSCDNTVRHNTFIGCYGTLSFRHGNRNRAEGNYFFGNGKPIITAPDGTSTLYTGGIRVYGTDHVIINNYFQELTGTKWDAPITLTQGDAIDGSGSLSDHFRAERVVIAYNTLVNNDYGIEIGYDNGDKYKKQVKDITIANNLITGKKNSLVRIVDGNDQGDLITWSNNLMYPTGTATIISGQSTTVFDNTEVVNENPNLVYNETEGTWKSTATTPSYTNTTAVTTYEDIEGQTRPTPISNPGADQFSTESIRYQPLTTEDVGPNAYEDNETPPESLSLSPISDFSPKAESQIVTITSNQNWSASVDNQDWISINNTTGSQNGTITVTVTANKSVITRTGTLTVTAGSLVRTLAIKQLGVEITDLFNLINDGTENDKVTVTASTEQTGNVADNTLDKKFDTRWSGEGVGATITYDLQEVYNLDLVRIATTSGKTYLYEIQVSIDGINFTSVSNVLSNTTGTYEGYPVTNEARYVRILCGGQANAASVWNTIVEIEFYGTSTNLSVKENEFNNQFIVYPNPVSNILNITSKNLNIDTVTLYSIDGKKVLERKMNSLNSNQYALDVSSLNRGTYLLKISEKSTTKKYNKLIIINQ